MPTATSYLPRVRDKSASPSPLGSLMCLASSLENRGTKHCIRKLVLHPLKQGTKPPQGASPCTPIVPCTYCEAETPSRYWQGPPWLQLISKWCSQSCWAGAVPVPAVRRSGVPFWRRGGCKQQVKGRAERSWRNKRQESGSPPGPPSASAHTTGPSFLIVTLPHWWLC